MFEGALFVLAIVAGAVASVVGFGIGSLLTPLLASQTDMRLAVAAVSIPHLVATAYRLWLVRDAVDRSVFRGFGLASAAGSLVGAGVGAVWGGPWLGAVLAALMLFVGVGGLLGLTDGIRFEGAGRWAAGLVSGVFGGLVGNQGGVRSGALLGFDLEKRAFVATATASGVVVDLARVPVYATLYRQELPAMANWIGLATLGCLVGTVLGGPILANVPQKTFRRLVCLTLVLAAVSLLARRG